MAVGLDCTGHGTEPVAAIGPIRLTFPAMAMATRIRPRKEAREPTEPVGKNKHK